MKKLTAIALAAAMALSLAACSSNPDNNSNADTIDSASYKVGVGSYTVTENSASSLEGANGRGVASTTYVTVIFDSNNIIRKAYIDEVESKIYFDSNGQLVTNGADTDIRSKRELGDEYNMKPASSIGKEWYEQVNSIENWLVGKNINDIANGTMMGNMYGSNSWSDSVSGGTDGALGGAMNDAASMADGIVNGAESIVGDIVSGAESMLDGTGANSGSAYGNSAVNSHPNDTVPDSMSGSDGMTNSISDGNSTGNSSGGTVNWKEDLKASATIDTTNIQIALQKAYRNAR